MLQGQRSFPVTPLTCNQTGRQAESFLLHRQLTGVTQLRQKHCMLKSLLFLFLSFFSPICYLNVGLQTASNRSVQSSHCAGAEQLPGQRRGCPRQLRGHVPAPWSLCGQQQPHAASRGSSGQRWPKRCSAPAPAARRRGPAGGCSCERAVSERPR